MFKSRTVFVIGAGAGCDFNMPTGERLATDVAKRLNIRFKEFSREHTGDKAVVNALLLHTQNNGQRGNINPYLQEGALPIYSGVQLSNSIDTFMEIHSDSERVQLCGKLAIANAIAEAERGSRLYVDPRELERKHLDLGGLTDTWLVRLFRILNSGVSRANLDTLFSNISFINFNYDRCLETFFHRAVAAVYQLTLAQSAEFVDTNLKVIHPYGSIGPLPRQGINGAIPFGVEFDYGAQQLLNVSKGIRTYNEQVADGASLDALRESLSLAEAIVFFGFAFHPQNVTLLAPGTPTNVKRMYGTAIGISPPDCEIVEHQLREALRGRVTDVYLRPDLDCGALLDQFSRSFTMG